MTEPLNPVQIEARLRELSNHIAEGVNVVTERLRVFRQADRVFDEARSRAMLKASGTVAEKEAIVTLETLAEREALDVAEVAYKHADRRAKAYESELRSYQSIGASVRQMYGVAGRGEY